MKVYYAHPITIYGTKQEARDIETLTALGFDVLNPNNPDLALKYEHIKDMSVFTESVLLSDGLAFRAMPDGSIPAGVKTEIDWAKGAGKPVFELPSCVERRWLTVEQTREAIKESGYR
jgi:hypothetical protein